MLKLELKSDETIHLFDDDTKEEIRLHYYQRISNGRPGLGIDAGDNISIFRSKEQRHGNEK